MGLALTRTGLLMEAATVRERYSGATLKTVKHPGVLDTAGSCS